MKKSEIYSEYLSKLKEALEKDDFGSIDYILEFIYTSWIPENIISQIDEILQEITLYSELKEKDYKEYALVLIKEFEDSLTNNQTN